MKHNHHDHCEHGEVAYCGHCQVVYCKGCKREWGDCKLAHCWTGDNITYTGSAAYIDIPNDYTTFTRDPSVSYVPTTCSHA